MSNDAEVEENVNVPVVEVLTPTDSRTIARRGSKPLEYVPTHKEQALLSVLIDPEHRLESVKKQCELAGVSREFYYQLMRKPAFMEHYRVLLLDVIRSQAGQLINIAIDQAKSGSFPHLKLLMEMGGLHNATINVDHNVTGEAALVVRFVDPDSDLIED